MHLSGKGILVSLQRYLFDYRIVAHSTTRVSPASLMFGRDLKTRENLLWPSHKNVIINKQRKQIDDYKGKQKNFKTGDCRLLFFYIVLVKGGETEANKYGSW